MQLSYTMKIDNKILEVKFKEGVGREYEILPLPTLFLQWQSESRKSLFDMIKEKGSQSIKMQPAHLPVLATEGEGEFSINLANKGLGMLPKVSTLEDYINKFEVILAETKDKEWKESIFQRMKIVGEFYFNPENFDPFLLGGLEIFEGKSFQNILKNPRAALLFTGEAPKFPSYQFNGFLKIIEKTDPYFRFLLVARQLFARDPFHVLQADYPYGYLFYTTEIKDKTPFSRKK